MGKFKMPSVHYFLKQKRIYDPIKEQVWIYLEREMRENTARKPYNTKVANWLLFLKDLRYHYYCEAKYKFNRLCRDCGPVWYLEYSREQRRILGQLKRYIHEDLLEDLPTRVRKCLWDLGITIFFETPMLMSSMEESLEDPGLFMWILYTKYYKKPPSELMRQYNLNAMLMMSALVFIDLEECVELLNKLTTRVERPVPVPRKKKNTYFEPNVKYGAYLQKMQVPFYSNHPLTLPKHKRPMPLANKIRLRSDQSYDDLAKKTTFLEKRKERNIKVTMAVRKCKFKFWTAPATLRNVDPKMAAYVLKLKMVKLRPRARHLKFKPPFENTQFMIQSVSYSSGKPVYILSTIVSLPTGYILINGGTSYFNGEYITLICGMWNTVKETKDKCPKTCDCVATWEAKVRDYLETSKCYCSHYYDLENSKTLQGKDTFFYPPTRNLPLIFDHCKIYQVDPYVEYINDAFRIALASETTQSGSGSGSILYTELPGKELLKIFLADLSDSPLLIPHLPQANLLKNLQEWVRKRIKGNIGPVKHRQLMLKSQRRWLDLKHIDFRAQAYFIPFTLKQLEHMTWAHRDLVQKLFKILLSNFETRTRLNQLEQCRLWWSTMEYDVYPSEPFLDVFFTYMPGKYNDTLVVNPYCANTMHYVGKTCPLKLSITET